MSAVTQLLSDWRRGDRTALDALTPMVDQQLRSLAVAYMARERQGHTLQPTALVNEAFLRLVGRDKQIEWQSRAHFIAVAAQLMRQILVDYARNRKADKRGAGQQPFTLSHADMKGTNPEVDILALDQVLEQLRAVDERKARVVELRFFGGLNREEIADVFGIHLKTVQTDLRVATAWLRTALSTPARGIRS